MTSFSYRLAGLSLLLALFSGCAGHPLVATRSRVDGQDEPSATTASSPSNKPKIETQAVVEDKKSPSAPTSETLAPEPDKKKEALPVATTAENKAPAPAASETVNEEVAAVISTRFGTIVIELDEKAAPRTCANFEKLAMQGFYNRTLFHRVIPNFMIQGGDPNTKGTDHTLYGTGGPGYTIPAEIGLKHVRGAVAMARLGNDINPKKNSSGSQFFICVADVPRLDGDYTVFGHVIKGMEIADKIVSVDRDPNDCPLESIPMEFALLPKSKALEKGN